MELPSSEIRRALVTSYASVVQSLGRAANERPIVLPNGEFFPDVFTGDEASVQRVLDRMLEHAGLSDMAVVVKFWGDDGEAGCGTGACGSCGPAPEAEPEALERLVDAGDAWQVNVLPGEAAQPVLLSSALCRALALAVLREADAPPTHLHPDLAVDLTAVALGFGVLLLEGSHIYRKSCGGPSIARSTALGPSELALVLALSVATSLQSPRAVSKYLSATQQEAFAEAKVWADSNAALAQALQRDPQRIARGEFELREPASWLGRWLGGKARRAPNAEAADTIEELEAALQGTSRARLPAKAPDPKLDEIKRLVAELGACKALLKKKDPAPAPAASVAVAAPPAVVAPLATASTLPVPDPAPVAAAVDESTIPASQDFEDEAFATVTTANFRTQLATLKVAISKP